MNKKKYIIVGIIVLAFAFIGIYFLFLKKDNVIKDNVKFSEEYGTLTSDNVFIYKTSEELINILKHGTGVVYLGFPECPWCKKYVTYLNEVAIKSGAEKVYYLNILNDRKNNTDDYKEIVNILSDYLSYDDEGNKRVYVPAVIAVKDGKIVGFDDETSKDTKGYDSPDEYWKNEDLDGLKNKLSKMFEDTSLNVCTSDCNK